VGEDAGEEAEVLWFVGWVVGLIGVGGGGGAVGVGVGNVGGGKVFFYVCYFRGVVVRSLIGWG
jgi:hypothetical protein